MNEIGAALSWDQERPHFITAGVSLLKHTVLVVNEHRYREFQHAPLVAVDHPCRTSCAQRHSDIQNSRSCRAKQMVDNRVFGSFRKYCCFVDFCSCPMACTCSHHAAAIAPPHK